MTANMQQQADLHGVLVEAVDGIEDLKAAGAQGRFVRQYEQSTAAAAATRCARGPSPAGPSTSRQGEQRLVTLVLLVWGVHLIGAKELTAGALVAGMMFAGRAIAPLQSVVMLAMRYQGARAAMRSLNQIMGQPVERDAAGPMCRGWTSAGASGCTRWALPIRRRPVAARPRSPAAGHVAHRRR